MLSEELRSNILSGYFDGLNIKTLSERFGVSRPTVSKIIREHSKKLQKSGIRPQMVESPMSDVMFGKYADIIRHRTLVAFLDFTDVVSRRIQYISQLPQNQISNSDLATVSIILERLSKYNAFDKGAGSPEDVIANLSKYLASLQSV